MISIRLPDNSLRAFAAPVTVGEVAAAIGPGLAKAALGGRVRAAGESAGRLVDTSHLIDRDVDLAITTDRDADGPYRSRDPAPARRSRGRSPRGQR